MPLSGDKKREYQREWLRARRQAWIDQNGPCAKCGSTFKLEIDHIDPTTKQMPIREVWSLSPSNPKLVAELAKCQVLCAICHQAKNRIAYAEGEHGRNKYEKYGCRCDICTSAKRANNARRKR